MTIVWCMAALTAMLLFCSLAVDYGRAQLIKTQLRRLADATAHDYIVLYNMGGTTLANSSGPSTYSMSSNPVDGTAPTMTVTWGYWLASTKSFSTTDNGGNVAVRVRARCRSSTGNGVWLPFASIFGQKTVDISVTSIAESVDPTTVNVSVPSTSNPYFAGMPTTETSANGDNAVNNAPTQVSIAVVPGQILTFTTFTGTSSVMPGSMPYVGPAGAIGNAYGSSTAHGVSWNQNGAGYDENGIANAIMPESSLMGMFLNDNRPDATAAPATVDWTDPSINNSSKYTDLKLKAPFYIGTGKTSGGTTKQFVVPPGATRFFIATWDGIQFNNNGGSTSGSVTVQRAVRLVN